MASLNQVNLIGYVGDEPKVVPTSSQRKMVALSVGTTEKGYTTKDGQTVPDKTEWHSVVAFGKLAEIIEKYIHKGSQIFIQGKLSTRCYEKDGQKKYTTDIIADNMQMLDRKTSDGSSMQSQPQTQSQYQQHTNEQQNDDLPF